jgi:diguanylate cyclase (GGDEF)-like protein/PAS domain S-box-containing protein
MSENINATYESEVASIKKVANTGNTLVITSPFWQQAEKRQKEILDAGKKATYVFIDLENFRFINMQGDISEGARLLMEVSGLIYQEFPNALIARGASIQFVVLTEQPDVPRRIEHIHEKAIQIRNDNRIDIRAGIYTVTDNSVAPFTACDYAKAACAHIQPGYNVSYRIYDEELHESLEIWNYIVNRFRGALQKKDIKVFYQPVVRTVTGKVCSAEALARWQDPKYGRLVPGVFVPALEKNHLITLLDFYIAEEVCRDFEKMCSPSGQYVPISVNFSRVDFKACHVRKKLDALRRKYRVPRDYIIVEITEQAFGENLEELEVEIKDLRDHGYQVWMDDFGSGFSSLSMLKNVEVDLVKFDLRFLSGGDNAKKGNFILGVLISMVKQLGIGTLVEGVETKEQLDFLKSVGCERIQGYYYSKPCTRDEMMALDIWKTDETPRNRSYYDAVGHCDLMQAIPGDMPLVANAEGFYHAFPAAIFEYREGKISLLSYNAAFQPHMRFISGTDNRESWERMLKDRESAHYQAVISGIQKCLRQKKPVTIMVVIRKKIYTFSVEHIAHDETRSADALILVVMDVKSIMADASMPNVTNVLNGLFSIFDDMDVYDVKNSRLHRIKGSFSDEEEYENRSFDTVVKEWAVHHIYTRDRKRFLSFYNPETIKERIKKSRVGYLSELFRVVNMEEENGYNWQLHVVWLVEDKGSVTIHRATINLDQRQTAEPAISGEKEKKGSGASEISKFSTFPLYIASRKDFITPAVLWQGVLSLPKTSIYWKDVHRRYLGVNQSFLDYYGLQSVDDIKGKTADDIGWHVDPAPLAQDEYRLINFKEPVVEAHGQTLRDGTIRDIVINKIPLMHEGMVVGILGWFRDITDDLQMNRKLLVNTQTDGLTGALNYNGFTMAAQQFEHSRQEHGINFAVFYLDIDNFKQCNDTHNHSFGNEVLCELVRRLKRLLGSRGVLSRIGGDEFVILKQFEEKEAASAYIRQIKAVTERPMMIDGESLEITLSIGLAFSDESSDMKELLKLADSRMYDEKKGDNRIRR